MRTKFFWSPSSVGQLELGQLALMSPLGLDCAAFSIAAQYLRHPGAASSSTVGFRVASHSDCNAEFEDSPSGLLRTRQPRNISFINVIPFTAEIGKDPALWWKEPPFSDVVSVEPFKDADGLGLDFPHLLPQQLEAFTDLGLWQKCQSSNGLDD